MAVVERDSLNIAEVDLFKGVVEWATKEAEKRDIVADGREKRRILGDQIVKVIGFPVTKQEEFASVVLDSKILTSVEVNHVTESNSSVQRNALFWNFPKPQDPVVLLAVTGLIR